MKDYSDEPARSRNAVAIGIWENEGGAPGSDPMDHQYGQSASAICANRLGEDLGEYLQHQRFADTELRFPAAYTTFRQSGRAPGRGRFLLAGVVESAPRIQPGRPIETDRPWTVYPVFTGVSAPVGGDAMIGPSRMDATDGMISINLRNIGRREERLSLGINACEIAADRS